MNGSEIFKLISPEENRQYSNIIGITGDPLTPEQEAEIASAMEGLTPVQEKRA